MSTTNTNPFKRNHDSIENQNSDEARKQKKAKKNTFETKEDVQIFLETNGYSIIKAAFRNLNGDQMMTMSRDQLERIIQKWIALVFKTKEEQEKIEKDTDGLAGALFNHIQALKNGTPSTLIEFIEKYESKNFEQSKEGISGVVDDVVFVDREDEKTELHLIFKAFMDWDPSNQKLDTIPCATIFTGSGMGKTKFVAETYKSLLPLWKTYFPQKFISDQNFHFWFVNFNSPAKLSDKFSSFERDDFDKALGFRIACHAFFGVSSFNLAEFANQCFSIFKSENVLEEFVKRNGISKDNPHLVICYIDEVQMAQEQANDLNFGHMYVKDMIQALMEKSIQFREKGLYLFVILTGMVNYSKFWIVSKHGKEMPIYLSPLTLQSSLKVLQQSTKFPMEFLKEPFFLKFVKSLGIIPSYLVSSRTLIQNQKFPVSASDEAVRCMTYLLNHGKIISGIQQIGNSLSRVGAFRRFLYLILSQKNVSWNSTLNNNNNDKELTLEKLGETGLIYIVKKKIYLPHPLLKIFLSGYDSNSLFDNETAQQLLDICPYPFPSKFDWELFERFCVGMLVVRSRVYDATFVKLRELLPGARGSSEMLDLEVKLTPLDLIKEVNHRIAKTKTKSKPKPRTRAKSNDEVDAQFQTLKEMEQFEANNNVSSSVNKAFLLATGNPLLDARVFFESREIDDTIAKKVLLVFQMKASEKHQAENINPNAFNKAVINLLRKSYDEKEYSIVPICITNKKVSDPPSNGLVIDIDGFDQYAPCLSHMFLDDADLTTTTTTTSSSSTTTTSTSCSPTQEQVSKQTRMTTRSQSIKK